MGWLDEIKIEKQHQEERKQSLEDRYSNSGERRRQFLETRKDRFNKAMSEALQVGCPMVEQLLQEIGNELGINWRRIDWVEEEVAYHGDNSGVTRFRVFLNPNSSYPEEQRHKHLRYDYFPIETPAYCWMIYDSGKNKRVDIILTVDEFTIEPYFFIPVLGTAEDATAPVNVAALQNLLKRVLVRYMFARWE